MNRKDFMKTMAFMPLFASSSSLTELNKVTSTLKNSERMPVLFLGHGSPMNAIEENEFVQGFRNVGKEIPKPSAILCISAHWETKGTFVTAMQHPPTIHDFGGFPQALYEVQYPAPGSPELAQKTKDLIKTTTVGLDDQWGLDHGAWSVIKHLYPDADVPVVQMSIDYSQPPSYHYALAREIQKLKNKGVLIIGSGNMVHNLRLVAWNKLNEAFAFDWAQEASDKMKQYILNGDHQSLINFRSQGKAFEMAIPTPEHYLPLLYALGLKEKDEEVKLFNDVPIAGSLTMTSVKIGN
ncbi:MAG: 4,5-DOPA dioxygenase extradiol [Lewinellaceae bacterium]|nr:4,5-DOPA dioxygenase extradiol [Lewinellaceae bacterium]